MLHLPDNTGESLSRSIFNPFMITLRNLSLARGTKVLLDGVDLTLHQGQKIGLVGANGAGKSTLFALLRGELHQDSGDLDMPPRLTIAHVAQETPALDRAAIEYILDGDVELRRIEHDLAAAETKDDGHALAELHHQLDLIEGYSARSRAAALLHGLGFAVSEHGKPVSAFSGGWRMRLNLAQALMCRSDLLLLDEPTNHLDLETVLWLEQWLGQYQGTLMLISHDRDFLDGTVSHICHIDRRTLKLYAGNYSAFERQRAANLAQQQAAFEKQQREIAHLHAYIDRFRAKATKARQAQSRMKALERMEEIAPAHVDSPFDFRFREFSQTPDPLLSLENIAAGYDDEPVLSKVQLVIRAGDRIGLLGKNGAGKSTLIKLLAGEHKAKSGERREGKGLAVGYFAQHQLEHLRLDESPLQHLVRLDGKTREQELRNFLGGFNFHGDQALAPIAPFSGGEKARLALALLIWQRPNLLLLDEPTNHLDLDMRHALNLALQEYDGAIVVVSHDRHLLKTTTESLLLVANGAVTEFEGDLDDYRNWLNQTESKSYGIQEPTLSVGAQDRRDQKRQQAEARNARSVQRRPLENAVRALEREIDKLHTEKIQVDGLLATGALYSDSRKEDLKLTLRRQAEISAKLSELEEQWLLRQTELEML